MGRTLSRVVGAGCRGDDNSGQSPASGSSELRVINPDWSITPSSKHPPLGTLCHGLLIPRLAQKSRAHAQPTATPDLRFLSLLMMGRNNLVLSVTPL